MAEMSVDWFSSEEKQQQLQDHATRELGAVAGITGFGIGERTLRVYVLTDAVKTQIPETIKGVKIEAIVNDEFKTASLPRFEPYVIAVKRECRRTAPQKWRQILGLIDGVDFTEPSGKPMVAHRFQATQDGLRLVLEMLGRYCHVEKLVAHRTC